MMRIPLSLIAGLLLVVATAAPSISADAPAGQPTRVRGTIDKLDGSNLTVVTRDGSKLAVALAPGFTVGTLKNVNLADIKPGDYVGSAAVKGADGKLRALELHLFPEPMRGTAEGHFPWDLGSDSSMTNATVGQVVSTADGGRTLTLTYKGGETAIDVPPDAPIVTFAPGDPSMLVPGRAVMVFAIKKEDGTLAAARVTVENDGVKPPM